MNLTQAVLVGAAFAAHASAQQTVYAIGNGGSSLVSFQSNDPGNVSVIADFSGDASFLDAIDFRPATGELFGYLDGADAYFTVNLATGSLTQVSANPVGATTNTFFLGMDFNPTIDRLRVVTESRQNIVFNPNNGTATDVTSLFYADGDPNQDTSPRIIDNAYTQNFAGAMSTMQYGIDYSSDTLVTIANNDGVLTTVGSLGINTDIYTGFDIFTDANGVDTAYAILTGADGIGSFYTIDMATGAASLVGGIGFTNQVYSLAVVPAPGVFAVLATGMLTAARRRRA